MFYRTGILFAEKLWLWTSCIPHTRISSLRCVIEHPFMASYCGAVFNALCSFNGIPLSAGVASSSWESSTLAPNTMGKAFNYKRAAVTLCKNSVRLPRGVILNRQGKRNAIEYICNAHERPIMFNGLKSDLCTQILATAFGIKKYLANRRLLTMDQNMLCPFPKAKRNGMVQNRELINANLQNLGPLLGIAISGLLVSDIAIAATQSGLHAMSGDIHAIVLADLDPSITKIAINLLGPLLQSFNVLFIVRIVMSWYPQLPVGKFPYVIAYAPTEPFLSATRKVIAPVAGVDVSPVVWFAFLSFLNEILLGPQGLLVLISQQQM